MPLRLILSTGYFMLSASFTRISTSPGASETNSPSTGCHRFRVGFYGELIQARVPLRLFLSTGRSMLSGWFFDNLYIPLVSLRLILPSGCLILSGSFLWESNTSPGASEITSFYRVFYAAGSLSKIGTSQRPLRSIFSTKQYYFRVDLTWLIIFDRSRFL